MTKRGWFIRGVTALLGIWICIASYQLLEREWQKKGKAAKEEQGRCEARYARFKTPLVRRLVAPPAIPDVWARIWTDAFNRVREGQSEAEIEGILGQPVYTRCDVNHAGDRFEGSVWQYTIVMPPNEPNNVQNNTIQIVFGPDGKVKDKGMMHVEFLYMKPPPSPSAAATPQVRGTATPAVSSATAVNK